MTQVGRELVRLTPEMRARWEEAGFLVVTGALSAGEVARLVEAVDRLHQGADRGRPFNAFNVVEEDDAFLDLVDHPNVIGLVADLVGVNLLLLMSQAMVRPPTPGSPLGWHHDGPKPHSFPAVAGVTPLINLKIGWFLTDLSEPDQGNFVVVPGSHVRGVDVEQGDLEHSAAETTEIATTVSGAVQVLAKPGDAILFHNGLWHAVAPSRVDRLRKVLYYAYGPSWLRLQDREATSAGLLARVDPVKRQLLGGLAREADHGGMHSGEEGVPLLSVLGDRTYTELMEDEFRRELAGYQARDRA